MQNGRKIMLGIPKGGKPAPTIVASGRDKK